MGNEFVTLATYETPVEASLAQNQLEAEGVRTFLADEATVGWAWYLGNALGGVKLQVRGDDAERATAILEAHESVSRRANGQPFGEMTGFELEAAEEDEPDAPGDDLAERAFRAAGLGLLLWPLQLYSLWLLARLAVEDRPISAAKRTRVLIALVLDSAVILAGLIVGMAVLSG